MNGWRVDPEPPSPDDLPYRWGAGPTNRPQPRRARRSAARRQASLLLVALATLFLLYQCTSTGFRWLAGRPRLAARVLGLTLGASLLVLVAARAASPPAASPVSNPSRATATAGPVPTAASVAVRQAPPSRQGQPNDRAQPTPTAVATPTAVPTALSAGLARAASPPAQGCVPPPPYSERLAAVVEAAVGGQPGKYGVAVLQLETGEAYLRGADEVFPAASVYKLMVLYEARRQIELGKLSPTATLTITPEDVVEPEPEGGPELGATLTVDEALAAMVTRSSNAAAHALLDRLSREAINRSAMELDLGDTLLPAPGWHTQMVDESGQEEAATSPRDQLCFLTMLNRGELVGPSASAGMRDLLLQQQVNDRLPALLPPDARVAHKTGELPGVRNDVGIVYAPWGSWAVAVLSRGTDWEKQTATIASLSRRLYDYFAQTRG